MQDIKPKISAFLSCVEVTRCVKFQIPSYNGFKVGIFRISPIANSLDTGLTGSAMFT